MRRTAILGLVLLVAGVDVADGASSCFDDTCQSGASYVNIYDCVLTDDDVPDLVNCLDEVGRDNIVSVYLANHDITTLPADTFEGLGSLVQLSLTDSNIDAIPSGLFDGLDKLVSLSLGGNQIATLHQRLFEDLGSLSYLSLTDNNLGALPPKLFDGLEVLSTLFLADNLLTTLPDGLFDDLGSLNTLYMQGNPDLQCVPANGASVVKVDEISFDQCECTPDKAVRCGKGRDCVPGASGYTCEKAMHKLGSKLGAPKSSLT